MRVKAHNANQYGPGKVENFAAMYLLMQTGEGKRFVMGEAERTLSSTSMSRLRRRLGLRSLRGWPKHIARGRTTT